VPRLARRPYQWVEEAVQEQRVEARVGEEAGAMNDPCNGHGRACAAVQERGYLSHGFMFTIDSIIICCTIRKGGRVTQVEHLA
jgi:hypothetical protein